MELPLNVMIPITIGVLVLAVIGAYFALSSQQNINQTGTQSTFFLKCNDYAAKDCDWSVTKESGFDDFLASCQQLYGSDQTKFSCLYIQCKQCQAKSGYTPDELNCVATCNEARGSRRLGLNTIKVCEKFNLECGSTKVDCSDACP